MSGRAVLTRLRTYYDGAAHYRIGGDEVEATEGNGVEIAINTELTTHCPPALLDGFGYPPDTPPYPSCPDCGGPVAWAEAGRVPGARECGDCGSLFSDSRYGC